MIDGADWDDLWYEVKETFQIGWQCLLIVVIGGLIIWGLWSFGVAVFDVVGTHWKVFAVLAAIVGACFLVIFLIGLLIRGAMTLFGWLTRKKNV